MVHFVGAGSGAVDLITVRGQKLIQKADVVIYAGSLVNPNLLLQTKAGCLLYDSAYMTLEEVIKVIEKAESEEKMSVRLHTGDPSIYGAIREQMDLLSEQKIAYEVCPGVSSFCGAAAALKLEYTLPEVSQSVIITRVEGRTSVPKRESIREFAAHQATMVLFLSIGMAEEVQEQLLEGGYAYNTPVAIVYKATWPEEKIYHTTVEELAETVRKEALSKTALIIIGNVLGGTYARSKLYDPAFTTGYREADCDDWID